MAPVFGSRHSPLSLARPHGPLAATVPLFGLGSHLLISHVPVALASKLKPWMWNVHTCGSFSMTDLSSPAPSWILTVPLLPAGSAYAGPAERSKSATAATNVRIPVGLRIGVASSLMGPRARISAYANEHGALHRRRPRATVARRYARYRENAPDDRPLFGPGRTRTGRKFKGGLAGSPRGHGCVLDLGQRRARRPLG